MKPAVRKKYGRADGNSWIQKLSAADGCVLACDVVAENIRPEMKAMIDRMVYAGRARFRDGGGTVFMDKLGMPIVLSSGVGSMQAAHAMLTLFGTNQMILPAARNWNTVLGRDDDILVHDAQGFQALRAAAREFAWALQTLRRPLSEIG